MNCRIESQFVNLKKKKKFKGEIREIIKDRCECQIGIHSYKFYLILGGSICH